MLEKTAKNKLFAGPNLVSFNKENIYTRTKNIIWKFSKKQNI